MVKNLELILAKVSATGAAESLTGSDYLPALADSKIDLTLSAEPVRVVAGDMNNKLPSVPGGALMDAELSFHMFGGTTPKWLTLTECAAFAVSQASVGGGVKYTIDQSGTQKYLVAEFFTGAKGSSTAISYKGHGGTFGFAISGEWGKPVLFKLTGGKMAVSEWPAMATQPSITKPDNYIPALKQSSQVVVGSTTFKPVKFEINGNMTIDQMIDTTSEFVNGIAQATEKDITGTITVYEETLATNDPYTFYKNQVIDDFEITWGKTNEKITISSTHVQITDVKRSTQGNLTVWDLSLNFLDDFTITVNSDLSD